MDKTSAVEQRNDERNAVEVRALSKSFDSQKVLDRIDLDVKKGETVAVLGRSGAGKSVLLKLLIGLQRADSGSIRILGHEMTALRTSGLNRVRKRMGFSFQYSALFDSLDVERNVAFPLDHHTKLSTAEKRQKVLELLRTVGMEGSIEKLPAQLSGGMRKRVGIARALALDPEVMLFDEPTAGLDPITAHGIDTLIRRLGQERNIASIVVTHDLRSAGLISDRVMLLNEGRVSFEGPFEELERSSDPFVQQFLVLSS